MDSNSKVQVNNAANMSIPFESIISSGAFKFLVGRHRRSFTLHTGLVSHQSKVLKQLVNGPMAEANEACATWEDISEGTFIRFSQYIYTGNYDLPTPTPDTEPEASNTDGSVARKNIKRSNQSPFAKVLDPHTNEFTGWGDFTRGITTKKEPIALLVPEPEHDYWAKEVRRTTRKTSDILNAFANRRYEYSMPQFKPQLIESPLEYGSVLLCHAQLYVFAEKYDITNLKALCLHKLHRDLTTTILDEKSVEDIVRLLQYSYENTADRQPSMDDLRSLLAHYTACVIEDLAKSPEFLSLLEESSQLGSDVLGQMLKRLG